MNEQNNKEPELLDSEREEEPTEPHVVKIAIGGPPHSGKSVLVSVLRSQLPHDRYAIVEAAPDGEGITGWSHEGDPELTKAIRRKGKFLPGFTQWAVDSLHHSTAPITIADLGGMLLTETGEFSPLGTTLTPQNEQILSECDYIIVIASPQWSAAVPNWLNEANRLGVKPLAVLDSVLMDADDEVLETGSSTTGDPLRARITKLERDAPPTNSATARILAQLMDSLAEEGGEADGSQQADVNFPDLAKELNLPQRNGGVNRDWPPDQAKDLLQQVTTTLGDKAEVNLWGNCSAGWPYHLMACNLSARVRYYDPKLPQGYIPLNEIEPDGEGSHVLHWQTAERDDHTLVEFVVPDQIFNAQDLPLVIPPSVNPDKGVIISGKGPWWLTGTIARAYAYHSQAHYVAIFTPQEATRTDEDGTTWKKHHSDQAPAVVVASRDREIALGAVIPFDLL